MVDALNSLPVAIVVMVFLIFLQAIGTMIPQEHLARPQGMTLEQMYLGQPGCETARKKLKEYYDK